MAISVKTYLLPTPVLAALSAVWLLLSFAPNLGAQESASSLPIDLSRQTWIAQQGFESYRKGECQKTKSAQTINKFPIILNDVFHVPSGDRLLHYTLCLRFPLRQRDLDAPLGLHLSWIGEAWELYLNGKAIRKEMPLDGEGQLAARRLFRHITIPLERSDLKVGENTMVFHIAGYQAPTTLENNTNLGFVFAKGYTIDRLDRLQKKYAGYFRVIQISIFAFFGLYHIVFFAYRMRDRYNLYFGLFLLAMAGNTLMGHFFTKELYADTGMTNRLKFMFQATAAPMIVMFIVEYFLYNEMESLFKKISFAVARLLLGVFSIFALLFLLLPFRYTELNLLLFQKSMIPLLLTGLILMIVFMYKRKSDAYIMGTGVLLLIVSTAYDVLNPNISFLLTPYGTLACVFALVFMLARRFLKIHQKSELLNEELAYQKDSFERFVPFQFLELLKKKNITEIDLGDSSARQMSVMFSDIRNYTQLSEQMSADENFRFLNSYMKRMEPAIKNNDGFVDKYIGDAILALFPEDASGVSSADRAIQTSIHLQKEILIFNEHRRNSGYQPIQIGIAINTGAVMLGTVGSSSRMDTTVIGNVVNLASRLESLNKFYNTSILISGFTLEAAKDADRYALREIDAVRVVGKREPVVVHEIFEADPPELREKKEKSRKDLMNALILYKLRDFREAQDLLLNIIDYFPEDRVTQIYLERCAAYLQTPPPDDWIGVVELTHK